MAVAAIQRAVTTELAPPGETFSDRLDRVLTHKVWGTLIFLAVMALMFQSIFTFARIPMDALQGGVDWLGHAVGSLIPPGDLNSLLVDGVIAGVGAVVVFLPQILLLFLFIGFLEDTGYMARAAFLMDRLMSKVGLHGKSFIPMLSSFACAIPGIMATRTIESPKDRLVTILVAPLMSCSARLPVYTLLIAACIPNITVLGFFKLPGLTMLAMYLLGIVVALVHGLAVQEDPAQGRDAAADHGAAALQAAPAAGGAPPHVGPLEAFPAARRHGHPGHQYPALVSGHLPAQVRHPGRCRGRERPIEAQLPSVTGLSTPLPWRMLQPRSTTRHRRREPAPELRRPARPAH